MKSVNIVGGAFMVFVELLKLLAPHRHSCAPESLNTDKGAEATARSARHVAKWQCSLRH